MFGDGIFEIRERLHRTRSVRWPRDEIVIIEVFLPASRGRRSPVPPVSSIMKIPQSIKDSAQIRSFSAGTVIFEAETPGDEMFIVEEGEVDIVLAGRVLETVVQDGIFGEMALIDHAPRSTSAIARTDCKLIALNQRRFTFLVDEIPFFAIGVMKVMADRLRRASIKEE